MFGENVRLILSGGGVSLNSEFIKFLKICLCTEICEIYGSIESGMADCMTYPAEPYAEYVGGPLQAVKLRLKNINAFDIVI